MADESDGIEEALEGQIRVLVTTAGQMGERLARQREQAARQAEAHSQQEARELQSRMEAEHRVGRAEVRNVYVNDWWKNATPEQIAHTYQIARAWMSADPEIFRAEQHMQDELRTRYGIDIKNDTAPETIRDALNQRTLTAEEQRVRAAREQSDAAALMKQADSEEHQMEQSRLASEHEPDAEERERARNDVDDHAHESAEARTDGKNLYDSAGRRAQTARELESLGIDPDVVAVRMRADVSEAKPATEAVKGTARTKRTSKIRKWFTRPQAQKTGRGR